MDRRDSGSDWMFIGGLALGIASLGIMALVAASILLR
jgi:hypothetical protein